MDHYYIMFVLPAVIIALIAQAMVSNRFSRWSRERNRRGMSGADAANAVLRAHGIHDVHVESVRGHLTDHYDPRSNTIRLSENVYSSVSIAAVGIAAHEAGHAVQHAQRYAPVKTREAIIPITQIGSTLTLPLIIIGMFLNSQLGDYAFIAGILLFALSTIFQLITLPVEFDASRRALDTIGNLRVLDEDEMRGAKQVLGAAAMTYVAALAVSLMNLLRLVLIFGGRRRD